MENIGFATSPGITKTIPENIGEKFIKWLISSQISVHESPIFRSFILSLHVHFYCQDTFISIFRTHTIRTNERDLPGITKIYVALMELL